jgi:DNA-binding NarL/FixJ family response regulator
MVSAWPALALVASFELLMMLIRTGRGSRAGDAGSVPSYQPAPPLAHEAPPELSIAPTLEQTVRARYEAGHSQRAIARELNINRRKVRRMIEQALPLLTKPRGPAARRARHYERRTVRQREAACIVTLARLQDRFMLQFS